MNKFQKALKEALSDRETGKREHRQAEILKITRERTEYVYNLFLSKKISKKEMGDHIRKGEADISLLQHWIRNRETGERVCCLLCIRAGKRCVCRKVSGIECSNCLCKGECIKRWTEIEQRDKPDKEDESDKPDREKNESKDKL